MRQRFMQFFLATLTIVILSGCAGMQRTDDQPAVSLTSFRFLPGDSIVPKFEIGLRILNPNRDALELHGLFYNITIEDNKIISGVANELPTIEGYGEENILLEAAVDVIGGAKLLQSLLHNRKSGIDYGFNAKLDLGAFQPPLLISEKGEFSMSDAK